MLFSVHASGLFGFRKVAEVGRFIDRELCKGIGNKGLASSTYSLVHVDGVLAGDNVGDGRTGLPALGGLDGAGHFCNRKRGKCQ